MSTPAISAVLSLAPLLLLQPHMKQSSQLIIWLASSFVTASLGCSSSVNGGTDVDGGSRADANPHHIDAGPVVPAPDAIPGAAPDAGAPGASTADDGVAPYNGLFSYGSNGGYFGGQWTDDQVFNLMAGGDGQPGVGVHSLRGALYDDFLNQWGATVRVEQFTHYQATAGSEQVIFINENGEQTNDQDPNSYGGCSSQSQLQKNMYLPIFIDDGSGGQMVNPDNSLAAYVATMATTYKGLGIRFYEVYNEPDFTGNDDAAQNTASSAYWGTVNPDPCDLINTNAPISHHVRLHRVIYEVIHSIDPNAFVATGGVGYPAYLDALLRNTDNPGTFEQNPGEGDGTTEGAVSSRYPKGGGAYFDVLSFHSYPQYGLSSYAGNANDCTSAHPDGRYDASQSRCFFEHSDAAVAGTLGLQTAMQAELVKFGYDGTTKPAKHFILTETNVPRVPARYADGSALSTTITNWGSDDYAKNYAAKMNILGQKNGIRQIYLYGIADEVQPDGTDCSGNLVGTDNSKVMGLFQDLSCVNPYAATPTVQATMYSTMSSQLYGFTYDATETAKLALPSNIDGAAFKNSAGVERYALWVKTTEDRTETGSATYAFPSGTAAGTTVTLYQWDASSTSNSTTAPNSAVPLTAAVTFIQ